MNHQMKFIQTIFNSDFTQYISDITFSIHFQYLVYASFSAQNTIDGKESKSSNRRPKKPASHIELIDWFTYLTASITSTDSRWFFDMIGTEISKSSIVFFTIISLLCNLLLYSFLMVFFAFSVNNNGYDGIDWKWVRKRWRYYLPGQGLLQLNQERWIFFSLKNLSCLVTIYLTVIHSSSSGWK